MPNWYVSSAKWNAVAQFAVSTAYTVGAYIRPLAAPTVVNRRVFKCTTAGTSGATEPTWNQNDGATTTSGTAVFTQVAGREAEQLSGNWRAPIGSLAAAHALVQTVGDVIYVADDHSESYAADTDVQGVAGVPRICVDAGSTVPPVEAELSRGATITTTGNFGLNLIHSALFRGFNFNSGVGGTNTGGNMSINSSNRFEDCRFLLGTSSASALINLGSSTLTRGTVEIAEDCRFEFSAAGQTFSPGFSEVLIRDCPNLVTGATLPTSLMSPSSSNGARPIVTIRNCNLSNLTGTIFSNASFGYGSIENCLLNASATFGSGGGNPGLRGNIRVHNSTSSTTINNVMIERTLYCDTELVASLFRTGGATDGVTPCSWRMTSKAGSQVEGNRSNTPRIAKRVNDTGVSKTFTVEALLIVAPSFDPKRRQCYGEFNILTNASSPVSERLSTRASLLDNSNPEASLAVWSGGLPARANSTTRSAGFLFSLASNPDRVFVVTTAGTTAASEPAAYATATDGATFADGSTTVYVTRRIRFRVTATPGRKGLVFFNPVLYASSGNIMYVDPKITVS